MPMAGTDSGTLPTFGRGPLCGLRGRLSRQDPVRKIRHPGRMLPSILRLVTPAARRLREHVLAGDDLAVARGGALLWLTPSRTDIADASRGRKRLAFSYRADDGETLTLHFGLFAPARIRAVLAERHPLSMAAVERRWRPTLSRIGRIPEPGSGDGIKAVAIRLDGPAVAAARRAVHPSYLVDRLMMR